VTEYSEDWAGHVERDERGEVVRALRTELGWGGEHLVWVDVGPPPP